MLNHLKGPVMSLPVSLIQSLIQIWRNFSDWLKLINGGLHERCHIFIFKASFLSYALIIIISVIFRIIIPFGWKCYEGLEIIKIR